MLRAILLFSAQVGPGQSWQRQSPNQQVERQAEPATTKVKFPVKPVSFL